MAQIVKNLPAMRETWVWSLDQEDPLEKEMATHSSILAWRIPWTEEPGGLQSTGSRNVRHDWATSLSLSLLLCRWGVLHRVLQVVDWCWSCIQMVPFVWVLTIWYTLGLVFWLSSVLQSVFPLQSLRAWSLSKHQPRSNLPRGISPEMKGLLLEFQKPVYKNTTEISDSMETWYCLPHGQSSLDCNTWLEGLSLAVVSRTLLPF